MRRQSRWKPSILGPTCESIADCDVFSRAEEIQLNIRRLDGDMEARDLLIRSQLKWAMHLATQIARGRPQLALDLFTDAGIDGVMLAVNTFDHEKGRLITLTNNIITKTYRRYIRNGNTVIRIPTNGHYYASTREFAKIATGVMSTGGALGTTHMDFVAPKNTVPPDPDTFWDALRQKPFELTPDDILLLQQKFTLRQPDRTAAWRDGHGTAAERKNKFRRAALKIKRGLMQLGILSDAWQIDVADFLERTADYRESTTA